ncbi:LOW QUALITY PROTEIN: mast cell protease 1A-like [Enhydra lutris kenyoni]|uniref:LOW QUALITY PROTEIN: mast cell protease 1A-like n=1 Tax=Enhydra lutris kenyoni TaxID=391180 RepID=A0A2Y9IKB7_ENHLU|nr:LOW QUALITY PROTEIN: mast cell protease 1A-like [Enhydra lutris kenyoni]
MQLLLLLVAFLLAPKVEAGKIIRGHEAKPHSRPFMAFLQIQNPNKTCGGFLEHKDFVLTAVHCKGSSIRVILGTHNIKEQERTQQVIPVRKAIHHSDYNPKYVFNNIMLLQLEKAHLTAHVSPLRLPKRSAQVWPGMVCSVAGWGCLSMNSTSGAWKLHEVELEVQRNKQCISCYKLYNGTTQMCVGNPKKKKSSFKGDSGGPLLCNMAQGIVSFRKTDGEPPRVYTRISSFFHWIERTMRCFSLQGPD